MQFNQEKNIRQKLNEDESSNNLTYSYDIGIEENEETVNLEKEQSIMEKITFYISMVFYVIALLIGISYYVLGIVYLINDYDESHNCKDSNLWAYVLVSLLFAWRYFSINNLSKNGKNIFNFIGFGIIYAGLSIWGYFELWNNSCNDLDNSNLWKFGEVTFFSQSVVAIIFLVVVPLYVCCI